MTVEFGPGVTTLVGRSDAGKSTVVRAIRWLAFNRPSGKAVIRHGEEEATSVLITDKYKVLRRRGKANVYALDGKKLVAFGNDVPDVVKNALNVHAENLQRQFDPPFWLSLPPGELAKRMNAITGMDVIEGVKAKLSAKVRRLAAESRVIDDEVKYLKRNLREAREFGPTIAAWEVSKSRAKEHAAIVASLADLDRLTESLVECDRAKDGAESLAVCLAKRIEKRRALVGVRKSIRSLEEYVIALSAPMPELSELSRLFAAWQEKRTASTAAYERRGGLEILIDELTKGDLEWRRLRKQLARAERSLAVCPTCGSTLAGRPVKGPPPS